MQIISACLARDLPVYRITYRSLREHLPGSDIHVVTRKEDFSRFRQACGEELNLWDEATLLPGMTLEKLRQLPLSFFPKGAGWYFQQFLKFAFIDVSNDDDYFLIWDADTVLLRPLDFFDAEDRPIYTKASEHHLPYFETFEKLFGEKAEREFSFISQHQVIHKPTLRAMLTEIEERYAGDKNWAWVIMESLQGKGSNLFSEYETYGHYMKLKFPGSFTLRNLPWTRHGEKWAGYPPNPARLESLRKTNAFAAFEAFFSLRNRFTRYIRRIIGRYRTTDYPS